MKTVYTVQRTGRKPTFDVYRQSDRGLELVEGGFFTRTAAEAARAEWQAESDKYAKENR